ncbi:hypothetical protein CHLNCDRAFT_145162 [Chlorella variabilis]|uniref:Helicase-associated domain-containing protein n=1 Tax=Chlorella variabilis TaxID=554065 RepID=E1ZCR0_CHLVA|nr:hypothetical protein CHLNCDRAFT_145162 [Chlorella variabilis]EFN56282.1 hypothetical protein CHLNCDRAFT_145162 [Chlorella variabilis]|eukprot:XP_005848384.1 hypothetical protein CHLNCDRAFT_145162 [Chlorella variabilis]
MLEKLRAWKERNYDCIVPRKVHDAGDLGEWVHHVRLLHRRGQLPAAAQHQLEALSFSWVVDGVTAKWYHNLHAARRYREVHGSGDIPPDFADPSHPDWVEAARWLARQRDLYGRQKLLLVRVRLLKELLGVKLHREYSRPRRNMHAVLREGNARFRGGQRTIQGGAAAKIYGAL